HSIRPENLLVTSHPLIEPLNSLALPQGSARLLSLMASNYNALHEDDRASGRRTWARDNSGRNPLPRRVPRSPRLGSAFRTGLGGRLEPTIHRYGRRSGATVLAGGRGAASWRFARRCGQ